MSAQVLDRPAMRQVFGPTDVQDVTSKLEKNRWGAFLAARSTISKAMTSGGAMAADLAERLHLGGFLRWAARTPGWLLGGLSVLRRGVRTAGVLPGLGWVLTTDAGQGLRRAVGHTVVAMFRRLSSGMAKATSGLLSLFGAPGQRLAVRPHALVGKATAAVTRLAAPGRLLLGTGLMGLVTPVVGALCRERALKALVGRFLAQPWALLARVALNLMLLPASIRREAVRTIAGVMTRRTSAPGVRPTAASTHPAASPVTTSSKPAEQPKAPPVSFSRPPITSETADPGSLLLEEVPARYPSSRSKNAKRK